MITDQNIKSYYPVGQKTLFMFIFNKSGILFLLAAVLLSGLFGLNYIPYNYLQMAIYVIAGFMALFLTVLALVFLTGWLQYIHYGVYLDQKMLKVKKGLLAEEMSGIPYKHIQDVKIVSGIFDQLLGVSNIIITVSGPDDPISIEKEHKMYLPSLERTIALEIQDSILKLAQVAQIDVLGGQRFQ